MQKIKKILFFLRCLFPSLYFDFKYLPFRQAIKLPILVYKYHLLKTGGGVIIDAPKIYTGMIRLGLFGSALYPNTGLFLKNEGLIIFKGSCRIGNDCHIICGKCGRIVFGDNFIATAGLKLVSMVGITFGRDVLIGWGNTILDTNFHPFYDIEKKKFHKAFGKIIIGDNNWFAMQCVTMPGVTTPNSCIWSARTILTRDKMYESFCIYGGSPVKVLRRNVVRIIGKDSINDYCDKELMM